MAFDYSTNSCFEKSSVAFGSATVSPNVVFAFRFRYAMAAYSSLGNPSSTSGAADSALSSGASSAGIASSSIATVSPTSRSIPSVVGGTAISAGGYTSMAGSETMSLSSSSAVIVDGGSTTLVSFPVTATSSSASLPISMGPPEYSYPQSIQSTNVDNGQSSTMSGPGGGSRVEFEQTNTKQAL